MAISIDYLCEGLVKVSERGEGDENGYSIIDLVINNDQIDFQVRYHEADFEEAREKKGITFRLAAYHVENTETKRAFHTSLELTLRPNQVRQLRSFMNMDIVKDEEQC